jgi:hypothetical protein
VTRLLSIAGLTVVGAVPVASSQDHRGLAYSAHTVTTDATASLPRVDLGGALTSRTPVGFWRIRGFSLAMYKFVRFRSKSRDLVVWS